MTQFQNKKVGLESSDSLFWCMAKPSLLSYAELITQETVPSFCV